MSGTFGWIRKVSSAVRAVRREAASADHVDGTQGPVDRAVRLLAWPMATEMFAESVFAVVDVFWVARLGASAIAAVGLVEAAMSLIYAFGIGLAFATGALVARQVGETGRLNAGGPLAGQALALTVLVSFALGLPMAVFAFDILRVVGADDATARLGVACARVMFSCNVTLSLMFVCGAALRGIGQAKVPMRALWLANSCNMVLAPCLIFGWAGMPELGVAGAAVATTASRGLGVLYQTRYLAAEGGLHVRWADLRPRFASLLRIGRIAWNGTWQMLVASTSAMGLFAIAGLSGDIALAGCTVALRVSQFVLMPSLGVARAAATLVGQNLGAGKPDRATAAIRIAAWTNMIVFGVLGALLALGAAPVAALLTPDARVALEATRALRMVAVSFPFYAAGMCLQGAFNGAGDTLTPARVNFLCFWVLQVPMAWWLAEPMGLGTFGLYLAVVIGFAALAVVSGMLFVRGRWKAHLV